jgi:hypothetical protein
MVNHVRKNATHKENSQEKSHLQEQGLMELSGGGSIPQEVKPEDEMATDSENGEIIALSFPIFL